MVSASGLVMSNRKTSRMLDSGGDHPLVMQLFGNDTDMMVRAAAVSVEEGDFEALGINMACPMPKIYRKGSGARLMEDPAKACAMVRELKRFGLPVWPKIRKCGPKNPLTTVELCEALFEAGADHISLHGRTAAQRYEGASDVEAVLEAARRFPGRISASGDVYTTDDVRRYLEGGCVAVLLARGIIRDPFLLPRALHDLGFEVDERRLDPSIGDQTGMLLAMADDLCAEEGERVALILLKRFLSSMFKGLRGAGAFRRATASCRDLNEFRALMNQSEAFFERGLPNG
jgi:tRNA-dihydrouridine synthase